MSANLMSLGGLAIAIGMLVDAAVVVVENVVQHLGRPLQRKTSQAAHRVSGGTRGRSAPVAAGMLIIAVVFLPC
jgi:cobalt-zinc-cadmium resistance protein CzcA